MRVLAVLLLAALPLAGCVEPVAPAASGDVAVVYGVVTDLGLAPLARASVTLLDANETVLTGDDGAFVFPAVRGEAALVRAEADGFFGATRRVSLLGATAEVRIALEPVPVEEAYSVAVEHAGFVSCAAMARVGGETAEGSVLACGARDPNDKRELEFTTPLADGIWGAVLELTWEPSQPLAGRFHFSASAIVDGEETSLGATEGDGYARIVVTPTVARSVLAGGATLVTRTEPAPSMLDEEAFAGAGVAIAQPFTVLVTIFYYAPPPPAYSALPG